MALRIYKKQFIPSIVIIVGITLVVLWIYEPFDAFDTKESEGDGDLDLELVSKKFVFSSPRIRTDNTYAYVSINEADCNSISDGLPVLPVNVTVWEFPLGIEIVNVTIKHSSPSILNISKKVSHGIFSPVTIKDETIYSSTDLYPANWVTYHTGGGLHNDTRKAFFVLRVYPVRYIPGKNQLLSIDWVEVKVLYKRLESPVSLNTSIFDLLLITPPRFSLALKPLLSHKENQGLKTKMVTLDEIYDTIDYGRDNQEKVKYYIKRAIEEWNIKYVLLVGGMKRQSTLWHLPVRYSHVVPYKEQEWPEESFLCDLYYADIYDAQGDFSSWDSNGNNIFAEWTDKGHDLMDLYPDVYLGRWACRNYLEVLTMVQKTLIYETNEDTLDWFKNIVLIGGDSYNDNQGYIEGEIACDEALMLLPDFQSVKIYASTQTINRRTVGRAFNAGCGFAYFVGHGTSSAWTTHPPYEFDTWLPGLKIRDMKFLRNRNKFPVVVVGGCLNAQFDVTLLNLLRDFQYATSYGTFSPECWAWQLTNKIGGGAIATIANTGLGTHGREDTDNNKIPDYLEVLDGWLELRFFYKYGIQQSRILGAIHGDVITEYIHRFLGNQNKMDIKMVQQWVLLGDPSLQIRSMN
jgi:hypothetical protein